MLLALQLTARAKRGLGGLRVVEDFRPAGGLGWLGALALACVSAPARWEGEVNWLAASVVAITTF